MDTQTRKRIYLTDALRHSSYVLATRLGTTLSLLFFVLVTNLVQKKKSARGVRAMNNTKVLIWSSLRECPCLLFASNYVFYLPNLCVLGTRAVLSCQNGYVQRAC